MATFLDFGLLKPFEQIFPFLFLIVFLYAVLSRFKPFEDKPAFSAIIAFVLSIMAMLSPILVRTINLMAPWLVLLIILIVVLLLVYQSFGIKEESIVGLITSERYGETFTWTIIALITIIFVGSLTTAFSEQQGFQQLQKGTGTEMKPVDLTKIGTPGTEQEEFFKTIFHPKLLGLILLMLVGVFTVQRLSSQE